MKSNMAKQAALCFALLWLAPAAWGQRGSAVPLIPAADWQLIGSRTAEASAVAEFGGDPAIEREYSVEAVEIRQYKLENTAATVVAETNSDASTAYGLLTFYWNEHTLPVPGISLAGISPQGAVMARGRLFFRIPRSIKAQPALSNDNLRTLLSLLAGSQPASRGANLPESLPGNGLVPGSEKYLLGSVAAQRVLPSFRTDLIGFSQGAEVLMGAYSQSGSSPATVLAITYPTPQIARARYGEMESILGTNQTGEAQPFYGKRLGSFVVVVLNANSHAMATKLVDAFALSGGVVPNERYPGDKPIAVQMMELIVNNILFVFILSGVAIGGGFLVFISKRFARKWFPDSDWVEPEEGALTVLRLR